MSAQGCNRRAEFSLPEANGRTSSKSCSSPGTMGSEFNWRTTRRTCGRSPYISPVFKGKIDPMTSRNEEGCRSSSSPGRGTGPSSRSGITSRRPHANVSWPTPRSRTRPRKSSGRDTPRSIRSSVRRSRGDPGCSTPSVGRVTERAEQQGDMVVAGWVIDQKVDDHRRIERLQAPGRGSNNQASVSNWSR